MEYVIAAESITLCPRHTEAVKNYKQPIDKLQLQRFLGLTNYFRKFIKDYALKAKPLQNLLKKDSKFDFNESNIEAFNILKNELTSSLLLRLYDPMAETQLYTDACSFGAILLQKQRGNSWTPIAYFS